MSGAGRARWGWHRVTDRWAEQLVADAAVHPGEIVLDIGAGTGALTRPLLDAGARVIAVELHPARRAVLFERFGDRATVVAADASDLRLPRRPFRVVANPPYTITTALVRRLLAPGSRLTAAHLVVQRAAARRLAEGRISGAGRWHRDYDIRVGRRLPRSAFVPPPPVDSAVLTIRRR
ncbi:MAG: rRNA adenine N(6)-methyltransferase family protein [Acidimicrobiales bacterium]